MSVKEWDQATPNGVIYKLIDTRFLADLKADSFCEATHLDDWSYLAYCDRPTAHTGRHLALERLARYPVAVWS